MTGVGPVAAGVSLGRLLGAGGIDGVVNLGLAGSFDLAGAPLGSLVAATAEAFPEYGLRQEGTPPDPKGLGFPQITITGEPIYDRIGLDPDAAARAMVGGRVGKDGIHGATFSSEELHEGSPATAVQIGDPITQRKMYDFLMTLPAEPMRLLYVPKHEQLVACVEMGRTIGAAVAAKLG